MKNSIGKINSHNEWDKLQECIVGTAQNTQATITWNSSEKIDPKKFDQAMKISKDSSPKWFYDEVTEDLDNLAKTLSDLSVKVLRPNVFDFSKLYTTPSWSSTSNNAYNVRDLNLVVGDMVIESPSHDASRYFETTTLYDIWYEYYEKGFKWIAAPKPKLNYDVLQPYYRDENERKLTDEDQKHLELTNGRLEKLHKLSENEILFEAANTLRLGKDLLYLQSSSGNAKAGKWLKSVVGDEYNVHITDSIYRSSHIDSTLMALRPGLILVNSARATEKNLPKMFDKWDKIYFEDVAETSAEELEFQKKVRDPAYQKLKSLGFETNLNLMSSPWVGMNLLSYDQETVIVDERQTNLIKVLEKYKFKIIPIKMRHIYTQGGGIHCATLDTVRDSKLESYFE